MLKLKTVKIELQVYRALKLVCKKRGQYLSHCLTEAIKQWLERQQETV